MFNLTPVVRLILILNVLAFLVTNEAIIQQFGMHSFLSSQFQPYQLLTHMFLHGGFNHIFSNMLGLVMFGPMLEHHWGSKRFGIFYFVCGLGAALLFAGVNYYEMHALSEAAHAYRLAPSPAAFSDFIQTHANDYYQSVSGFIDTYSAKPGADAYRQSSIQLVDKILSQQVDQPMVGASGAVFGILMAFGMLFPNTQLMLLFPPIPIRAKYFVLLYGAYELYSGVYQRAGDNVAHFAHIGGMLFAFILVKYWNAQRKTFY